MKHFIVAEINGFYINHNSCIKRNILRLDVSLCNKDNKYSFAVCYGIGLPETLLFSGLKPIHRFAIDMVTK